MSWIEKPKNPEEKICWFKWLEGFFDWFRHTFHIFECNCEGEGVCLEVKE
ncbi:hypothetical protein [Marinitoga lauensis]|nr:hypothetical protein [Marinitoga lauensis]